MKTMKVLMKGNEAIGEAAIRAGCDAYFGYPITPQTEVLEYMSRRMPELGRVFVQAESELGAINMVYGAACTGARVLTTTSSPGYSLMQEALSYIAMSFVPCVIANIMRGGPGLGNIQPAQGDYFQMTKGGGHGDYHLIVLAPSTVQETVDLMIEAFDLADKYRQPVTVIADGMIGQIMEPVEFPQLGRPERPERPWALTGAKDRKKNVIHRPDCHQAGAGRGHPCWPLPSHQRVPLPPRPPRCHLALGQQDPGGGAQRGPDDRRRPARHALPRAHLLLWQGGGHRSPA
jgi:2-oxoglutarate ferredoxin oxidoreductase subunit alpha